MSNFFVTMNTNIHPQSEIEARELSQQLGKGLKRMFKDHEAWKMIIKFLIPGHSYTDEYVQLIKTKYSVERGSDPRGGRIHAHAWIHVRHTSKIHLSVEGLRKALKIHTGLDVPYINIRMIRTDPFSNVERYIDKDNLYEDDSE